MSEEIRMIVYMLAWWMEAVMFLICVHAVFGEKLTLNWKSVGFVVVDVSILAFIHVNAGTALLVLGIYIWMYIYSMINFKVNDIDLFLKCIISIGIATMIETCATIIVVPFEAYVEEKCLMISVASICSVFLGLILKKTITKCIKVISKLKRKWHVIFIGMELICVAVLLGINYQKSSISKFLGLLVIVLVALTVLFALKIQQMENLIAIKEINLKLQGIYGNTYEEMITQLRRQQHDYKNQLAALKSIHMIENDNLDEKCVEYIQMLEKNKHYDDILFKCNNSILAGFLYHKCVACEASDIVVDYDIFVDEAECQLALYELIEILGILVDNAQEAVSANGMEKKIGIVCREQREGIKIEVENPAEYMDSRMIEDIFRLGYSSKGEQRGIGLNNVKRLASKIKTDILVQNKDYNNQNWISFQMIIPKKEMC